MVICLMLFLVIASAANDVIAQPRTVRIPPQGRYGCLPPDVTLDTTVGARRVKLASSTRIVKETVRHRLDRIKARCKAGDLIDPKGQKIRFFRLEGCWGNPPADYLEILDRQKNELKVLKRNFRVIEIDCDSSGTMPL